MTGFGSASSSAGGLTVGVSAIRQQPASEMLGSFAGRISALRALWNGPWWNLSTGILTVSVGCKVRGSQAGRIDEQAFQRYLSQLLAMRGADHFATKIDLAGILNLPGWLFLKKQNEWLKLEPWPTPPRRKRASNCADARSRRSPRAGSLNAVLCH